MKSILTSSAFVFLLAASNASASPLSLADVGGADNLLAKADLANNADDTEAGWISTVLGIPLANLTYSKVPASNGTKWELITGETVLYAFNLGSDPSWFMVKTGSGSTYSNFLYENTGNTQYAVVDFTDFGFDNVDIQEIKHVGIASDPPSGVDELAVTPVPEPATLTLFGAGLSATAAAIRRRKKSS